MDERRGDPDDARGRLTTTIARPRHRRASDAGRSRLGDVRRGIAVGRLVPRLSTTWLFGLAALVVAGAIAAALFGLPVRTWFEQDRQLQALEHQLTEMQSVNNDLKSEVDRLQTDDGIREAAREELGLVEAGDNRQTMMALPPLPTDLPEGWPYSQVSAILAVRAAADENDADAGAASTSAAPSTTPTGSTTPTTAP